MKLRLLTIVFAVSFLSNIPTRSFSQKENANMPQIIPSQLLVEGVARAKKKKFDDACREFESALTHWQVHSGAKLYLKIIDDVDAGTISKNFAKDIFKAVHEDFNIQHEKAIKKLRKLQKKQEDYFPIPLLMGEALSNWQKMQDAETAYGRAISLAPDSQLAYLQRGKFYLKVDERDKAIADFTRAIALDEQEPICVFERGFAYCVARQFDKAIQDFGRIKQQQPDWYHSSVVLEAFYNRGIQRMDNKAYAGALKDFEHAIAIDPEYLTSYMGKAHAYEGLKKYSQAIAAFTEYIAKRPDDAEAHYQRALIHFKRKHFKQAGADLEKALILRPGDLRFEYKLAESHYKEGQYQQAIASFDRVLQADASNFWSHYWKGYSYKYLGSNRQAVASFEKFLTLAPKRYRSQRTYAEIEIRELSHGR